MPFSTSDGVTLWTTTTGTASSLPPVVVVHGGPGLWDDYAVLAEMLDDLTVVHRFDQRGCGRSGPSELQSVRRTAQDIDELREYWGHERIVVLGHSFGATLALAYASWYADRAAGLVYVGGVGIGEWHPPTLAEEARRRTPAQRDRLVELEENPRRTAAEETEFRVLAWFTDHADRAMAMTWARESAAVDLPINFAANRALTTEVNAWPDDFVAGLATGIRAPVTFVHGAGDPRPVSTVRELATHLPRQTFHLVPDAGHSPWREQPELFREVLREAVQGC
ncbi:alpha/beta fold hydrolase [Kribbella pittospori]|nr:alpha/beta hydrolase [Kribbella pittospori]